MSKTVAFPICYLELHEFQRQILFLSNLYFEIKIVFPVVSSALVVWVVMCVRSCQRNT